MNSRTVLFRVSAMLLPLILLALVEVALRAAGVGEDLWRPFRKVEGHEDHLILNARYVERYFNSFAPGVTYTPFAAEKADGTFRVFAFGGSTTAGFPANGYAFPTLLRWRLEAFLPAFRTEVVNVALTATNSNTIRDLSRDVVKMQPDAVVIYAGHNEYYGAFGTASSVNRLGDLPWLKLVVLRLKRSAIHTLLERAISGLFPATDVVGRTLMAEAVGQSSIPVGSDGFHAAVRQFERNVQAVLDRFCGSGVPVYLATLTSNLADQPPLGDDPGAREAYEEGLRALRRGDVAEARRLLERARDQDDLRFRAPGEMNAVIRELADGSCATLVDVESAFRKAAAGGVEGAALFVDHLHPTVEGHNLIAQSFFESLASHPPLRAAPHLTIPGDEPVVDPFDAAAADVRIARLRMGRPFVKDRSPEEESAAYRDYLRTFVRRGRIDSLAALSALGEISEDEAFAEAIDEALASADTANALRMYRSLLDRRPFRADMAKLAWRIGREASDSAPVALDIARTWANRTIEPFFVHALTASSLDLGRTSDANLLLERAVSVAAEADFGSHILLGDNLRRVGRLREAVEAYEAALALRPDDLALQNNIATAYLQLGDTAEAMRRYRAVLAADSTFLQTWINLALFYARSGQMVQARRAADRVAELAPGHPLVRFMTPE